MAFAQLMWLESLRDIEASLSANASKLYAMGFRSAVRRSTLADANESRDWRIRSNLAALLIRRARAPIFLTRFRRVSRRTRPSRSEVATMKSFGLVPAAPSGVGPD